jgi:MFS family permease
MPIIAFFRENARWIAGGFLLNFFSAFGQTFFISLSAGGIRGEYGLSNGQYGVIYMIATLGSALTLPMLGRIVDHFSVAKVTLMIMPVLALACALMAVSTWLPLLLFTIYLLRLFGQGMMTHTAQTAMARWFSGQRGRAVSFTNLGLQGGEASLPFLFVILGGAFGWRNTWFFAACIIVAVGLPAILMLMRVERTPRQTDRPVRHSGARDWTRGEVVRDPVFWMTMLGVLAPGFIATTIFFHQVYLVELRGWSLTVFAGAFVFSSASCVVAALITGQLIDKFSAVDLMPYFLLPMACACAVLAAFSGEWSAFAFMCLLGISNGVAGTLLGALWPEVYGLKHLGGIRSIIIALTVFGTAMGPGITGYLIDFGVYYPFQIAAMGVYCLLATGLMALVRQRILARNAVEPAPGVGPTA